MRTPQRGRYDWFVPFSLPNTDATDRESDFATESQAEPNDAPASTDLTRASVLKPLLQRHGLMLSKRFGQNFLVSRPHLMRVVDAADIQPKDLVFEIGPGVGVLTTELALRARQVVAVELDKGLLPLLAETLAPHAQTVTVVQADALRLDLPTFFAQHFGETFASGQSKVKVAANIPYNITSPILALLLSNKHLLSSITLMVQKEVARRLVAPPNSDDYSALSVFAQFHATVRIAATVPRGAFFPPPKVDSAVVHLVPHATPPVSVIRETAFFVVSRAAFGQRRKTLANALANNAAVALSKEQVAGVLTIADIDGQRRGETLTLAEIARIADALPADTLPPAAADLLFDVDNPPADVVP